MNPNTFTFALKRYSDDTHAGIRDEDRIEKVSVQTYTIHFRDLMRQFKNPDGPPYHFDLIETGRYVDKSCGDVPDLWEMKVPGAMLYHAQGIIMSLVRYLRARDSDGIFQFSPSAELAKFVNES